MTCGFGEGFVAYVLEGWQGCYKQVSTIEASGIRVYGFNCLNEEHLQSNTRRFGLSNSARSKGLGIAVDFKST